MSNVHLVHLPLLEATVPTSVALSDQAIQAYGAVVSHAESGYRLHRWDDLTNNDGQLGVGEYPTFANTTGHRLASFVSDRTELDLHHPRSDIVSRLCEQYGVEALVAEVAQSADGCPMVTVMFKTNASVNVVGKQYRCSFGNEPYDEATYRQSGGKCPHHEGGILS